MNANVDAGLIPNIEPAKHANLALWYGIVMEWKMSRSICIHGGNGDAKTLNLFLTSTLQWPMKTHPIFA